MSDHQPSDPPERCKAFVVLPANFGRGALDGPRCEVGEACAVLHLHDDEERWLFAHAGMRAL